MSPESDSKPEVEPQPESDSSNSGNSDNDTARDALESVLIAEAGSIVSGQ